MQFGKRLSNKKLKIERNKTNVNWSIRTIFKQSRNISNAPQFALNQLY